MIDKRLYAARKRRNRIFRVSSWAAAIFGLSWLLFILGDLLIRGISGINLDLFIQQTPPPGEAGGLANAILGSVFMTSLAVVLGTPIGIFAGTWLAEYGRGQRLGLIVRSLNDILLSAPSIIVGLFVYEIVVVPMGQFSGLAGAVALALIVIPIVVRQTESMLLLIPDSLREAVFAVGAPHAFAIRYVFWRAARAGMLTGILLAIARISGETAPLLFTALNNQFWSTDMTAPMASLPVAIFQMAMSPYEGWRALAWAGALLITAAVLSLNVATRIIGSRNSLS